MFNEAALLTRGFLCSCYPVEWFSVILETNLSGMESNGKSNRIILDFKARITLIVSLFACSTFSRLYDLVVCFG